MRRFLGVDAGGSFTRAAVVDLDTGEVAEGHAGPGNPLSVGPLEAYDAIEQAVAGALGQAGCHPYELSGGCLGIAGVARNGMPPGWREQFDNWRVAGLEVVSDLEIAHYGAFVGGTGILAIAGTGSSVLARDSNGDLHLHGGWGWLLGDAGSATDLGRDAIRATLWEAETNAPPSRLIDEICRVAKVSEIHQAIAVLHAHQQPRQMLARLAPTVTRLAGEGDILARRLVSEAAERLADVAAEAASRFRDARSAPGIAWSGGMFRSESFRDAFRGACEGRHPRLHPVPARCSPVAGAVLRAARLDLSRDGAPLPEWARAI